jgi:galactan 5-O-arabinofuranosyltransferase
VSAAVVAVAVSASRFSALSSVAATLGPPWAAGMIVLAAAAHGVQHRGGRHSRLVVALLAGAAAGFAMVPLLAGLHGTDQPVDTILHGDMAFRTEYVTRFAATWHLADFTFRGLNAYYPPAWFWLAGRSAHFLGIAPWQIVKPFTIGTIATALVVAYALWRAVLTPAGALSAAVGSSLVLTTQAVHPAPAWYTPYACFVAVTGAAWLAATLDAVRRDRATGRLVVLALVGAALALLYYLLFLLLLAVLVALAASPQRGRRRALRRLAAVGGAIAAMTAAFWLPLLLDVLHGGMAPGHYLRPDFLRVATGLEGPAALTVLAVTALVLLTVTFAAPASRAVLGLFAGTVLYQLASVTTLLLAHEQLQPHRAVTMLWATLGAGVPAAVDGLRSEHDAAGWLPTPARRALAAAGLALALPATLVLGGAQGTNLAAGPLTRVAHTGRPDLARTMAISRFITQTTGKPPRRLTVLSSNQALIITEPYYSFLPLGARWANPAAQLPRRVAVLRAAAACRTAACTTQTLTRSPFGELDAIVLERARGRYQIGTWVDGFPYSIYHAVRFWPARFSPAAWVRRDYGTEVILIPRGR